MRGGLLGASGGLSRGLIITLIAGQRGHLKEGADATLVSLVRTVTCRTQTGPESPLLHAHRPRYCRSKALPGSRWHEQMEEPLRLLASVSPSGLSSWSVASGGFEWSSVERSKAAATGQQRASCHVRCWRLLRCCRGAVLPWCGGAAVVPTGRAFGGRVARTESESERESEREREKEGDEEAAGLCPIQPPSASYSPLHPSPPLLALQPRLPEHRVPVHLSHITSLNSLLSAPWPSACLVPPPLLTPYLLPPSWHPRKAALLSTLRLPLGGRYAGSTSAAPASPSSRPHRHSSLVRPPPPH